MQGTIVKGIAGFYYIKTDEGVVECKARGKFRLDELTPMVGDKVEITVKNGKGVIDKIHSRINELIRPAVANVTQALVVFALKNPDVNLDLLNKFLINCEFNNLKAVVCFNKLDLVSYEEKSEIIEMVNKSGYEILLLKAKEGYGIDEIREKLRDNVTVLCGPSGAGKSTILNSIAGRELMETGEISEKLKRGKHTTRHSELIDIGDGFVVDTPGFSSFDIDFISKEDLQHCFPEFEDYINKCKFRGCLHYKEPNCAVKQGVEEGNINNNRYEFYIKTLEEIIANKNKQW
ncbi:ribosome small subunit-dependent GTPase A [Clostridium sp. CX1]|uniref:ribosome small subunit-dependent GTPase A n=1 Tax=Clostridium sp. CX1 TaxID=2978346 RepID=UPI0021C0C543|nr:ribosome small subunit-dependent GTPase A [Clostridium sp. CX1]MCT8976874.1 ribosome small subunit-dependent GTPase A [Clostridium sp. CX1]